jgi:hypothetical protein
MAQAISSRSLTAEAQVKTSVSPCGICVRASGTGTGVSPSSSIDTCLSPCSYVIKGMKSTPVGGRSSETVPPHRHEQQQQSMSLLWNLVKLSNQWFVLERLSILSGL